LTIVDVLLMVGLSLVEDDETLQKEYLEKLQKLKDFHVGKLEESNIEEKDFDTKQSASIYAKGDVGFLSMFKFGASLKQDYSSSEKNRTLLRKLFIPNRKELLDLVNEIINEHHLKNDKKLLLIIDDLEKKNTSSELFTKHKELLEKLEVLKIVMIPVNYATSGNVYKLNLRLNKNPISDESTVKADEEILKNSLALKKLIYNRIDKDFKALLPDTDDVIGKIISYSGGNIRQLLRLVSEASLSSRLNEGESISGKDVDESIQDLLNLIAIGTTSKISFLKYINTNHIPDENEAIKLKESIADNTIFAYFNGTPWYEVNPAIKQYISNIKIS